jgi:hypothetical protein
MKSGPIAMICRMLIVSLLFFSYQSTAGMIGTEQIASPPSAQSDRTQIQSALSRAEVASQLQALGVDVKLAQDRVAALTDDEARSLAGKLPTLPAGAGDEGWWIAAIIVIGVLVWWWWARK